jgi:hypothetical protein
MKIFNKMYLRELKNKPNLPFSCKVQAILQFFGIAIHNPFRDECCMDFECCSPHKDPTKDHCWLHISAKDLPITRHIHYEETAPIGTPGRTFIKKSKLVFNFRN